jgi:hypothetical protein
MDAIINLFMRLSKPIHKLWVVITFVLGIIIMDYFTTYPSLSFTKEKYETIEVLNRISKDTSVTSYIRANAKKELLEVSKRENIRYYFSYFHGSIIKIKSSIAQAITITPPPTSKLVTAIINITVSIFNFLWFVVCSSGIFLLIAGFAYRFMKKDFKYKLNQLRIIIISTEIIFTLILVAISKAVIAIISSKHIYWTALITQLVIFLLISMSVQILIWYNKRRENLL